MDLDTELVDKKEYDRASCDSSICSNGGTCMVVRGRWKCVCEPGFDGPECQEPMMSALESEEASILGWLLGMLAVLVLLVVAVTMLRTSAVRQAADKFKNTTIYFENSAFARDGGNTGDGGEAPLISETDDERDDSGMVDGQGPSMVKPIDEFTTNTTHKAIQFANPCFTPGYGDAGGDALLINDSDDDDQDDDTAQILH